DAVITGKDDDRHAGRARLLRLLQAGELDRNVLEPAERAGRFRQLRLAGECHLAMNSRDAGAFLVNPLG
ncbi:MAG TPA: hypothetical protein VGJ75_18230, partial [Dongiaceae bacterium]